MSAAGMGAVVSRAMEDEGFRREFMGNPFAVLDGWDLTSQEVRDLIFWLPLRLAQVDDAGEGYGKADQRIVFRDRRDAGRQLAGRLLRYRDDHPIVLALPRGGVPVGYEVARVLEAPLDVLVVRKLCAPGHTDFGIGAIAPGGMRVLDDQAIRLLGMGEAEIEQIAAAELAEMERYLRRFCSDRPPRRVRDRTVILVDDGLATGITARAAIQVIRQQQPSRIVLSLPVCPLKVAHRLRAEVEEVITVVSPQQLGPVSFWYAAFDQTSDEEVVALLDSAWGWRTGHAGRQTEERVVTVPADGVLLEGNLTLLEEPLGVVLFAHGGGSNRYSPRNHSVAHRLHQAGLATLLIDLLTPDEEAVDRNTQHLRFDIDLLARRLVGVTDWLAQDADTQHLLIGYFGASTGAAGALAAAAERPDAVGAIVSRGGRPDLVTVVLPRVRAPTLLIVGEHDIPVIDVNRRALDHLIVEKQLTIVAGATHLFEEPGALEKVAGIAAEWFVHYLSGTRRSG